MDEKLEQKTEGLSGGNQTSKKLFFIMIGVLILSAAVVAYLLRQKDTKPKAGNQPQFPYTLAPSKVTSAAGTAQSFTATYPLPGGWNGISDASFYIAGAKHDQWVRYNPATKKLRLEKTGDDCSPGQAATISNDFLIVNCGASSVSGPDGMPTITFNLTPQKSFSGMEYRLVVITLDQAKASAGAVLGTWTVK